MWMEETIGSRINTTRTEEAVATGADQIAVGCPFCRVMLTDGLTAQQAEGKAREEVEVLDVAQMLLASVKRDADAKVVAAEPDAEERADSGSISDTAVAAPAAAATETGEVAGSSDSDQEDAAKHNVAMDDEGGGHEMSEADSADEPAAGEDLPAVEEVPEPEPKPEPGDATEADDESVPEESDDEPEIPTKPDDGDDSPAEEITHNPDETEPVEEESREEEADTVPFSDPQPSSKDVSDSATELASDDALRRAQEPDDDAPKS